MTLRLEKLRSGWTKLLLMTLFVSACQTTQDSSVVAEQKRDAKAAVLARGSIEGFDRDSSYLFTAPHGGFDIGTGSVAQEFCAKILWDCVVARGYRTHKNTINVNRPSEGVRLAAGRELRTESAETVYSHFRAELFKLKATPLKLYVELHNNHRRKLAKHLEVATIGIDLEKAKHIKELLVAELAAAGLGDVQVLIEPVDVIKMRASANKKFGIMSEIAAPTLHLEFPRNLFGNRQKEVAAFLVAVLPRIADSEFR